MLQKACVELSKRFGNKEVTSAELQKECALLAMSIWYEVVLRQFPEKTKEINDYEVMPKSQRDKMDTSFMYDYIKTCRTVIGENWGMYSWLKELRETLKDDPLCVAKINEKLPQFESWIKENTKLCVSQQKQV